jgi:hypothetical protein
MTWPIPHPTGTAALTALDAQVLAKTGYSLATPDLIAVAFASSNADAKAGADLHRQLSDAIGRYAVSALARNTAETAYSQVALPAYTAALATYTAAIAPAFAVADRDARAIEKELTDLGVDFDPTTIGIQPWPYSTLTPFDSTNPTSSVATLNARLGRAIAGTAYLSGRLDPCIAAARGSYAALSATLSHPPVAPPGLAGIGGPDVDDYTCNVYADRATLFTSALAVT